MNLRAECPICHTQDLTKIHEMEFGSRAHLPDKINLFSCQACNFAFTWPRNIDDYTRYYKENISDHTQRCGQYKNNLQFKIVSDLISTNRIETVLDFGCGGGGLLHKLAKKFPTITFIGYDVNTDFPTDLPNLSFKNVLGNDTYNLVILSHVIEHITEVNDIRHLFNLVKNAGIMYIETPNPFEYNSVKKPHYCYYLDRLHINHFSLQSLIMIAPRNFQPVSLGTYEFPFPFGKAFPAQYAVFRNISADQSIGNSLSAYIRSEANRWQKMNMTLKKKSFYIYGFGDNFHRSLIKGGPLFGLESNIVAIIDKNAKNISRCDSRFKFLDPAQIEEIDGKLIVCTVSQFTDMGGFLKNNYPNSEVVFI